MNSKCEQRIIEKVPCPWCKHIVSYVYVKGGVISFRCWKCKNIVYISGDKCESSKEIEK